MAVTGLFLLPLIAACVMVVQVSAGVFAATSAARDAARAAVRAATLDDAFRSASDITTAAFSDQGLPVGAWEIECSEHPCLTPGSTVTVTVSTQILGVSVTSHAAAPVSEYRS